MRWQEALVLVLVLAVLAAEPTAPQPTSAPGVVARVLPLAGVAAAIGGGVFLSAAEVDYAQLTTSRTLTPETAHALRVTGEALQATGWSLIAAGAASLITGVILQLLPRVRLTLGVWLDARGWQVMHAWALP